MTANSVYGPHGTKIACYTDGKYLVSWTKTFIFYIPHTMFQALQLNARKKHFINVKNFALECLGNKAVTLRITREKLSVQMHFAKYFPI